MIFFQIPAMPESQPAQIIASFSGISYTQVWQQPVHFCCHEAGKPWKPDTGAANL